MSLRMHLTIWDAYGGSRIFPRSVLMRWAGLPLTTTPGPYRETERHSMSSGSTEVSADRIASELKGNTLRVYWFVMNASNQTVGVREAQRALSFSSPTLALYHLDKLRDLGLVSRDPGGYKLIKEVKVDVLKQFMKLPGQFFVPRFSLYAVLLPFHPVPDLLNLTSVRLSPL